MVEQANETITCEQEVTCAEIAKDLAARLVAGLSKNCYFSPNDTYRAYAATITAEVQLMDVDQRRIEQKIVVGKPDRSRPSRRVAVEAPMASPLEIRERSGRLRPSLERMIAADAPLVKEKRHHTPRAKGEKGGAR